MKPITFTLILICAVAMVSCRKDKNDVDIKTYDQQQIQQYISANGLTGMQRDLTSGDTTGMYYQILSPGNTAKPIDYSTQVSLVYTLKSFDGKFLATDTITNHDYDFVGHLPQNNQHMAKGVMLALVNNLKYVGGRMRLLVPSHLAFGTAGRGTGSSDANNRVAGNQSLDYYINIVDNQAAYDETCIKNYMLANNLKEADFTNVPNSPVRYRITRAGVPSNTVTSKSVLEIQYTGSLLNGMLTIDNFNTGTGNGTTIDLSTDSHTGLRQALLYGTPGAQMTVLVPSTLAYGIGTLSSSIPANSCFRYDVNILSVQQ